MDGVIILKWASWTQSRVMAAASAAGWRMRRFHLCCRCDDDVLDPGVPRTPHNIQAAATGPVDGSGLSLAIPSDDTWAIDLIKSILLNNVSSGEAVV